MAGVTPRRVHVRNNDAVGHIRSEVGYEPPSMTLDSVTAAHRLAALELPAGLGPAAAALMDDLGRSTRAGKGMRSALFEAVFDATVRDDVSHGADADSTDVGATDVRAAAGEALELLHEAFLVHDDLADGDDHRRGRLNLQGLTTARAVDAGATAETASQLGMVGALMGGDLLLVTAMAGFARLPVPAQVLHRVLDEVNAAVVASIAGEYADVHGAAADAPADHDRALAIGAAKTAAYSVTLPLVLGAILGGAPEDAIAQLRQVGRHLGTAYQVIDDVLGVFGDPAVTGKSNTGDLVRRAPTVLMAYAATTQAWPRIDEALSGSGHPGARTDPGAARELLRACGAREYALEVAGDLVAAARAVLDSPAVPRELRAALEPHLATALERTR